MGNRWKEAHPDVPGLMKDSGRNARICALYVMQGGLCYFCGAPMTLALNLATTATIEHLFPKSRGGSNKPENLAAAHEQCNRYKGNMTVDEFLMAGIAGPTGKTISRATIGSVLAYSFAMIIMQDVSLWYGALEGANPGAETIARLPGAPMPRMV